MKISFYEIPLRPVSVNRWLTRASGGRLFKSKEYREYVDILTTVFMAHKGTKHEADVEIFLDVFLRRDMDVDNVIKPILDSLQKAGVVSNDKIIRSIHVCKYPDSYVQFDDQINLVISDYIETEPLTMQIKKDFTQP